MATLIVISNPRAEIGRCNAKCYNAKTTDCDCICGGMNHGVGLYQAARNTLVHAAEWLEAQTPKNVLENEMLAVLARNIKMLAAQRDLFDDPPATETAD